MEDKNDNYKPFLKRLYCFFGIPIWFFISCLVAIIYMPTVVVGTVLSPFWWLIVGNFACISWCVDPESKYNDPYTPSAIYYKAWKILEDTFE